MAGINVGLWTLMTGKMLWSGYLGTVAMVKKKHLESPEFAYFAHACGSWWPRKDEEWIYIVMDTCVLSWQPLYYHSNQKMSPKQKKINIKFRGILSH